MVINFLQKMMKTTPVIQWWNIFSVPCDKCCKWRATCVDHLSFNNFPKSIDIDEFLLGCTCLTHYVINCGWLTTSTPSHLIRQSSAQSTHDLMGMRHDGAVTNAVYVNGHGYEPPTVLTNKLSRSYHMRLHQYWSIHDCKIDWCVIPTLLCSGFCFH